MTRCRVCNDENTENVEICRQCGAKVTELSMEEYSAKGPFYLKLINIVCKLIPFVMVIYLAVIAGGTEKPVKALEAIVLVSIYLAIKGVRKFISRAYAFYVIVFTIGMVLVNISVLIHSVFCSGGNIGLVKILTIRSTSFIIPLFISIVNLIFVLIYRSLIGKLYRMHFIRNNGVTHEEYEQIKYFPIGNRKHKFNIYYDITGNGFYFLAAALFLILYLLIGVNYMKVCNTYAERVKSISESAAKCLVQGYYLEKVPYDITSIDVAREDIVISPSMRLKAAYYNGKYHTDYRIDDLENIAYRFCQNTTGDRELFRFGTYVFTDFYEVGKWYELSLNSFKHGADAEFSNFIWYYISFVDNDETTDNIYKLQTDRLISITKLYFSDIGETMLQDFAFKYFLQITDTDSEYNVNGRAVYTDSCHINRVRAFTNLYVHKRDYNFFISQYTNDYGTEELCRAYQKFCENGIVEENSILDEIYDNFRYYPYFPATGNHAYEGYEVLYEYVCDYVNQNSTENIKDMEAAEALTDEEYSLLEEACQSYYNN